MNYNVIQTGSKGNALLINDYLLIDCGVSFKKLKDYYKKLQLILLTHIHSDHFNRTTIKKLAQERPTLRFGCCEWLVNDLIDCGVKKKNIDVYDVGSKYNYGIIKITPLLLYHNVEQCGYRVFIGDIKLIYATDTNTLDGITAKDYDYYFIEANYINEDIFKRISEKEANGEYVYEYDALGNHLSKEKCDEFILNNAGDNSKYIYLHQHKEREERE
jgi:L-ascorbate metabolism protein UlaG (beta-lactamase superfamily)